MGIKTYKPKTSSLRYKTTLSFDDLSKGNDPLKSLTKGKNLNRAEILLVGLVLEEEVVGIRESIG